MPTITKSLLALLAVLLSPQALANDNFTFGMGIGSFYSGIGINAAIQSETDLKYVAVGCISYSSIYGGTCGAGVGWVKTDIFDFQTPKHGASLYLGIVGSEYDHFDQKPVYGAGLGYHYFLRGIGKSGFNFGFTLVAGNAKDGIDTGGLLQAGYQF